MKDISRCNRTGTCLAIRRSRRFIWIEALVAVSVLLFGLVIDQASAAVFVKYDGIDGESKDENHDKWIDVLSIDWGAHKPGGGRTGQSRRRGGAIVEDVTLTIEYEKASPKLQEKCVMKEIIPNLLIEHTKTFATDDRVKYTYLRWELENVMVTSYQISGNSDGPLLMIINNTFGHIDMNYTQHVCDPEGDTQACIARDFSHFEYTVEDEKAGKTVYKTGMDGTDEDSGKEGEDGRDPRGKDGHDPATEVPPGNLATHQKGKHRS